MDEIHVQKKRCYVYQLMADKCNVARFNDSYVEPLCRLCGPVVMSALEEVEAGSIRPGGKMEFLLKRIYTAFLFCFEYKMYCKWFVLYV